MYLCAALGAHMRIVKKLDLYILRNFLLLFAGTFFICLFIFMMQFLWKSINALVGKGLSWDVLAQFFFYASLTLVPMSMPLAVLLASLISFGNMGEKLELLSMRAAGIPLVRILCPVVALSFVICGVSFYFQNKVQPQATRQLATMLWSMRQMSPELEIPEGIFYSGIPGYNIYVEHKDTETGLLYGMMIYTTQGGYDHMDIVLADSARLQGTRDKQHLKLTLYEGERFRNMDAQTGNMLRASIPYMRETFHRETDLIRFDANFNMMDANLFNGDAQTKELGRIISGIDSIRQVSDSLAQTYSRLMQAQYLHGSIAGRRDSAALVVKAARQEPFDTLYMHLSPDIRKSVLRSAVGMAQSAQAECEFRAMSTESTNLSLRRHRMEARKKFTLSLACMVFFFIGAPLGAIIRKGGLGVPVVTSVIIFIFYHIVNVGGEKMAKTGEWSVWFGVWLSTMVLAPIGLFLVNKANKDSVVFNVEGYRKFIMNVLGLRTHRRLSRKEVVIHEPDYIRLQSGLTAMEQDCRGYISDARLWHMPSYWHTFFLYRSDTEVIRINQRLEQMVEEMHNIQDNVVIAALNELPVLIPDAHTRPFRNARLNMACGIFFPLGILLWIRIWRFRLRLLRDMNKICRLCPMLRERLELHSLADELSSGVTQPSI